MEPVASIAAQLQAAEVAYLARHRKAVEKNLRFRFSYGNALKHDKAGQRIERDLCRRDIVRFCNQWVWTFDQRRVALGKPAAVPFILRPKQIELLGFVDSCMDARLHGLIEKSRDEGATYLLLLKALHDWLYREGFKMGVGSRKSTLVDRKDDMDAILPKFRFMLYGLPNWFRPRGFIEDRHDNVNRIYNPENGSLIRGEGGSEIGRGGRSTLYLVDEAAFLQHAESIDRSLSQNTETVIWLSTPNGMGNMFYKKRHGGRVRVFTLSWRDNPAKNFTAEITLPDGSKEIVFPWYERTAAKTDPVTLGQEVDIDYAASQEGAFIKGAWIRAAIDLCKQPGYESMQEGYRWISLDVGEGKAFNVLGLRSGSALIDIDGWQSDNTLATAIKAHEYARSHKAHYFRYDSVGPGSATSGYLKSLRRKPRYDWEGYNGGSEASGIKYDDVPDVHARYRFVNRKAEDQWALRRRFIKTYQHVKGIQTYPLHELISIPDHSELIAQLPVTRYFTTETGMIRSETKKELTARGIASPDYYEMLYMGFSAWKVRSRQPFIPEGL